MAIACTITSSSWTCLSAANSSSCLRRPKPAVSKQSKSSSASRVSKPSPTLGRPLRKWSRLTKPFSSAPILWTTSSIDRFLLWIASMSRALCASSAEMLAMAPKVSRVTAGNLGAHGSGGSAGIATAGGKARAPPAPASSKKACRPSSSDGARPRLAYSTFGCTLACRSLCFRIHHKAVTAKRTNKKRPPNMKPTVRPASKSAADLMTTDAGGGIGRGQPVVVGTGMFPVSVAL
mmetsp:Transcript_41601/g.134449  ORF Transcript_41601/g.134449 Transcript_41601/m.134449 type:complete len:234 (+) Transcript_41601:1530-2231(+)